MLALKPLKRITPYEFKKLTSPLPCFTKGKSVQICQESVLSCGHYRANRHNIILYIKNINTYILT